MDEIFWNKSKRIAKLISLFSLGLLFTISVGIGSTDIKIPEIEEGDGIWAIVNVDSQRQVGVAAWTNGSNNDDIKLYLYNQTRLVASASGSYDQVSIGDLPLPAGTYTVKAYLTNAYGGGTRLISITSGHPLSILPKYRKSDFNVVEGKPIWSNLIVDEGEWVFVNAWTNGSNNDDIKLYLYNQTRLVASASGYYDQVSITYLAPSAGEYTVKAYLTDAYGGETRTISVTSNCLIDKNGDFTPTPTPTSTSTSVPPQFEIIDINESSETAPIIKFEIIKEQNVPNDKYVLSGSAYSDSGIKSVIVNGKYVGTENWMAPIDFSGDGNNVIIATGNDGNTTIQNIVPKNPSSESGLIAIIAAIIGAFGTIIAAIITINKKKEKKKTKKQSFNSELTSKGKTDQNTEDMIETAPHSKNNQKKT